MGTILKNVVRFTGLTVGVPVALPHRLNVNGIPVAPRIGGANNACFTITANTINVTATRTADAGPDVDVYVEYWHTLEAVVPLTPPGSGLAGLVPLFFASCGGGGGGGPTTEHVSGDGSGPSVALDPDVDTSFIENTGSETNQVFTLVDGTVDGQIHNIVNESSGITGVTVTPDNLFGGTSIGAGFSNASAVLIWNANLGEWQILGEMLGFTVS